jgi:hypothetical protein
MIALHNLPSAVALTIGSSAQKPVLRWTPLYTDSRMLAPLAGLVRVLSWQAAAAGETMMGGSMKHTGHNPAD